MPRRDGLIPATIFFGRGLNTHPDAEALAKGELQDAARVRTHKGVLYMDKGTAQYGVATGAAAGPGGIGIHKHPTAPRLLVAAGGEVEYDSVGDGSVWTPIAAGLATDRQVSFAGQLGVTYIANGRDKTLRYQGGATTTELSDLPRPEDCPAMAIGPYPADNAIDEFETPVADWIEIDANSEVFQSTPRKVQGTVSMRMFTSGVAAGEGAERDLGAGGVIDLSDSDYIGLWIYSDRAGTWWNFEISEDDITYLTWPITINEDDVGKWAFKQWDLRMIPPAARDVIRYLRLQTTEAVLQNTWFDHLMHSGGLLGEYGYALSFYDTATRNEGPIGLFRIVSTVAADEEKSVAPGRVIVFPSRPVYLPDGADRVRLYRTLSGAGGRYYHIADITPAANAWSYLDNTPDKELGEAQVLNQWPGQCPRAAWLVPRGDRLWHVGGLVTGARNENTTTAVDVLNLASET
ncbi:MAG TPA: hypothetical protein VMW48_11410, partial [Vicinamibacterales bacterium]|nr:hypothetical protein [Vicinamibacterales bacterium]